MPPGYLLVIIAAVVTPAVGPPARGESAKRLLSCEFPFDAEASAATLSEHFGPTNVASAEIDVGEGETEPGTAIFPHSPNERVDILWTDETRQHKPRAVFVRNGSRWHTRAGLTLGVNLRTIERLNRRPFRLLGFAWDYGGTVMSWAGGVLESEQFGTCRVRARLTTGDIRDSERARWFRQVIGAREFSSGHPAMQALNPFVYEIWLEYRTAG
jgi:hypothetical protein